MVNFIISFILCGALLLPALVSAAEIFPDKSIKMLYTNACAECHGRRAKGGGDGPSLRNNDFIRQSDVKIINEVIAKGVSKNKTRYPEKYEEGMPATKNITEEEVKKLSELMKSWNK